MRRRTGAECAGDCCTAAATWMRCRARRTGQCWKAGTCGTFWIYAGAGEADKHPDPPVPGAQYHRVCAMRMQDGTEMDFSSTGIQRLGSRKGCV